MVSVTNLKNFRRRHLAHEPRVAKKARLCLYNEDSVRIMLSEYPVHMFSVSREVYSKEIKECV